MELQCGQLCGDFVICFPETVALPRILSKKVMSNIYIIECDCELNKIFLSYRSQRSKRLGIVVQTNLGILEEYVTKNAM